MTMSSSLRCSIRLISALGQGSASSAVQTQLTSSRSHTCAYNHAPRDDCIAGQPSVLQSPTRFACSMHNTHKHRGRAKDMMKVARYDNLYVMETSPLKEMIKQCALEPPALPSPTLPPSLVLTHTCCSIPQSSSPCIDPVLVYE